MAAGTTTTSEHRIYADPLRVHIAGVLIAFFRIRKGLTQPQLAEALGVSKRKLQDFEQGANASPFFEYPSAVMAEALSLSGQEILELQGAHEADDFLRRIRKAPTKVKAKAFQSLMIMPVSRAREWLRVVLRNETLATRLPASGALSTSAKNKLAEPLVDASVLTQIRSGLREACQYGLLHADLAEISQMLLYWARSLSQTPQGDEQREAAASIIRGAITKAKSDGNRIAWRHVAHAMCELDKDSGDMCAYLVETKDDPHDQRWNLDDLLRRSADRGSCVEAMDCVVGFLEADMTRTSLPMCALDLRTAWHVLLASRKDQYGMVASLADLSRSARLARCLPAFLDRRAERRSAFHHQCSNPLKLQCSDLARAYARRIVRHLAVFANTLPLRLDEFRTTVAASSGRTPANTVRRGR